MVTNDVRFERIARILQTIQASDDEIQAIIDEDIEFLLKQVLRIRKNKTNDWYCQRPKRQKDARYLSSMARERDKIYHILAEAKKPMSGSEISLELLDRYMINMTPLKVGNALKELVSKGRVKFDIVSVKHYGRRKKMYYVPKKDTI